MTSGTPGKEPHRAWLVGGSALLLLLITMASCTSTGGGSRQADSGAGLEPEPIVGATTPNRVLSRFPGWVDELVLSQPDERAAIRLTAVTPGVEVDVFFGSWCSDSRRELTRLWRALELGGGEPGFPVNYIGVDRSKTEPAELVSGREILYVPTLIVSRDGVELGRIIESAPGGIEADLADLVEGSASGWLSGRDDLEAPAAGDSR